MTTKENVFTKTIDYIKENFDSPINIVELGININNAHLIHDRPSHHWGLFAKETDSSYWCVDADINTDSELLKKTIALHNKETKDYEKIEYLAMGSINFLDMFKGEIDLLHLNSYMEINDEYDAERCQELQLDEVIIAEKLISENGLILISGNGLGNIIK